MFNSEFNGLAANPDLELNPPDLVEARKEFDAWALRGIAFGLLSFFLGDEIAGGGSRWKLQ